jgi:hypothetical protein
MKEPVAENRIPVHCTGCGRRTWMVEDVAADRVRRRRARCDICGAPQGFPSSMSYAGTPLGPGTEFDTIVFEAAPPAVVQEKIARLRAEEEAAGEKLFASRTSSTRLSWPERAAVGFGAAVITGILAVGAAALLDQPGPWFHVLSTVVYVVMTQVLRRAWIRMKGF